MNRRSFLKLIGATALATVLPLPKTPIEEVSKIIIDTPGVQRHIITNAPRLGRVMHPPRAVIINDNTITKITLTGHKENGIRHTNTTGSLLCRTTNSELFIPYSTETGKKEVFCISSNCGKMEVAS